MRLRLLSAAATFLLTSIGAPFVQASLGPFQPTCELLFESNTSIEAEVKNPTYGTDAMDAAKAKALIEAAGDDPKKLTEILISTYIAIRLHGESKEIQDVGIYLATRNLRERDQLFTFDETESTNYRVATKRFQFSLRETDVDTLLVGYFFAHEFEHMIQDLAIGGHRISRVMQPGADVTKIEEAAMRAEFVFLQLIPRSVREKLLRENKNPGRDQSPKQVSKQAYTFDLFLGAIGASLKTNDADIYIRAMWILNRYRPHHF